MWASYPFYSVLVIANSVRLHASYLPSLSLWISRAGVYQVKELVTGRKSSGLPRVWLLISGCQFPIVAWCRKNPAVLPSFFSGDAVKAFTESSYRIAFIGLPGQSGILRGSFDDGQWWRFEKRSKVETNSDKLTLLLKLRKSLVLRADSWLRLIIVTR